MLALMDPKPVNLLRRLCFWHTPLRWKKNLDSSGKVCYNRRKNKDLS